MRHGDIIGFTLVAMFSLTGYLFPAELIPVDEVLAVIDRTPILRSDLELASLVGFGAEKDRGLPAEELDSNLLDARIRLELQFHDLAGSGAVQRLDIDVARRVETMVNQAGDEGFLRQKLADKGLAWDDLEALALRIEATRAWVEERLRPRITVSMKDIEEAYERLVVAPLRESGETPPSMTRVHERLLAVVEEEKLNVEIDRWVERCRERYQVLRYSP
jgi:hypothetical protein